MPHYTILLQNQRVHQKKPKQNRSQDRTFPSTECTRCNAKIMSIYHYKNGSINRIMPSLKGPLLTNF